MLLLLCYIDVPILNCVYLFELNIVTSSMKIDMVRPFFSKPERKKKSHFYLPEDGAVQCGLNSQLIIIAFTSGEPDISRAFHQSLLCLTAD